MKTILSFVLFLTLCAGTLLAQTPAQNKETARKIIAAVDAGDMAAFAMYVSVNVKEHTPFPPGLPADLSDFEKDKLLIGGYHQAFPNGHTEILHIVAEGDIVIVHSMYTGTNTGPFMGMAATNKAVSFEQTDIIRFDASGKGVDHWAVADQMTMMQQLGLMPAGGK